MEKYENFTVKGSVFSFVVHSGLQLCVKHLGTRNMTQCQDIYLNLRTQLYRCYVKNHHWWILSNDHLNSSNHLNSSHHHLEIWNHPAPTRSHLHIHNISPANKVPQNWSTACFLITSNNLQTMPTFPSKLMKSVWRHMSPCQIKTWRGLRQLTHDYSRTLFCQIDKVGITMCFNSDSAGYNEMELEWDVEKTLPYLNSMAGQTTRKRTRKDRPKSRGRDTQVAVFQGWMTTRMIIRIASNISMMAMAMHLLVALWLFLALCSCWVPEATWSTAFPTCFLPSPRLSSLVSPVHTCCTTKCSICNLM